MAQTEVPGGLPVPRPCCLPVLLMLPAAAPRVCSLIFGQLRWLDTEEKHRPFLFGLAAYHAVL